MRPVKLLLEGFTSFPKRVEIDFRELELFAITGPTGAGKTSILDAMLYALYGCTPRVGEREIGRLISLGQSSVKVQFEFSSSGKRYRVVRTRKSGKGAAQALLEEHVVEEQWNSLCNNIREIDQRICAILGLDFEGFTRSVILPQGEFDRFLRGDSRQRTEILKDLLGLRVYERMMKMANERSRDLKTQAEFQEQQLTALYADATEENLKAHRQQRADFEQLRAARHAGHARLEALQAIAQKLKQSREDAAVFATERAKAQRDLETAILSGAATAKTLQECERKVTAIETELKGVNFDEPAFTELLQAVPLSKDLEKLREDLAVRRKELLFKAALLPPLETDKAAAAEALAAAEASHIAAKLRASQAATELAEFQNQYGSTDLIRTVLHDLEAAQAAMLQMPDRHQLDSAVLEAEAALDHLKTRHAAAEIRAHLKDGDTCPVCERVVMKLPAATPQVAAEEARQALQRNRARQNEWQRANDKLQTALSKAGPRTAAELARSIALESAAQEAARELQTAQQGETRASIAASTADQALQRLQHQLASMDTEIKRSQDKLRERAVELQVFPAWAALPLSELQIALKEQTAARQLLQTLEQQRIDAMKEHQKATLQTSELRSRELSLQERIREKEAQIQAAVAKVHDLEATLRAQAPDLAPGTDEAIELQSRLRNLAALVNTLLTNIAREDAQIRDIEQRMQQAALIRQEVQEKREQSTLYHELGRLLAADEFIGYVQREALSGLALAASQQLLTLSQGRYTLTLGDDKNEFFVVDQWNGNETRSVKTLSGGESFLASLALALALSEGLAGFSDEQARARLDSLFIDEGISSLDPESLETAITAIETLSSGKRMVGVISHVVELGERLPARIHVEKSQAGSTVTVKGHSHSMVPGGLSVRS